MQAGEINAGAVAALLATFDAKRCQLSLAMQVYRTQRPPYLSAARSQ